MTIIVHAIDSLFYLLIFLYEFANFFIYYAD